MREYLTVRFVWWRRRKKTFLLKLAEALEYLEKMVGMNFNLTKVSASVSRTYEYSNDIIVNQISTSTCKFVITENYLEILKRQICVCHFKQQSLAFTNEAIEVSLLAIRLFRSHLAKFSQERSHVTGGKKSDFQTKAESFPI